MASNCGQYPLARDGYFYVLPEPEAEFGQQVLPAAFDDERTGGTYTASHAVAPLSVSMGFDASREFTDTATGTRARVKSRIIDGKKSATFSIETYVEVAPGADLHGPDIHNLLRCAIGSASVTDAATGTAPVRMTKFEPSTGSCLSSFNLVRTVPGIFSETLFGCGVDTMSISVSGGDPITVNFSGSSYSHVQTGSFLPVDGVDYAAATAATDIATLNKLDVYQVQPKTQDYAGFTANPGGASSLWAWDKDKDAVSGGFRFGEANKADTIDEDAGTFDNQTVPAFTPGPDATVVATENILIVPFVPTWSYDGTADNESPAKFYTDKPLSSISGLVTITPYDKDDENTPAHAAISNAPITALEMTLSNNMEFIADEAFNDSAASGYIPGMRNVEGTISMRVKKEFQGLLLYRRDLFRRCQVAIRLGPDTGRRITIDMQYVEFEPSGLEVSGNDELTVTIPFKSMVKSSAAADVVRDFQIQWL